MTLVCACKSTTAPLSVDTHLKVVREIIWDLRANWLDLGTELGVNMGTLKVSLIIPHSKKGS